MTVTQPRLEQALSTIFLRITVTFTECCLWDNFWAAGLTIWVAWFLVNHTVMLTALYNFSWNISALQPARNTSASLRTAHYLTWFGRLYTVLQVSKRRMYCLRGFVWPWAQGTKNSRQPDENSTKNAEHLVYVSRDIPMRLSNSFKINLAWWFNEPALRIS